MNRSDYVLVTIVLFISILPIVFLKIISPDNNNQASVYYKDKLVLKIDMSINKTYVVKGYNGEVKIEVKDNKIRVKNEKSPLHICSKQGFVSNNYTPIICLPNKIVIKITNQDEIDTVIG